MPVAAIFRRSSIISFVVIATAMIIAIQWPQRIFEYPIRDLTAQLPSVGVREAEVDALINSRFHDFVGGMRKLLVSPTVRVRQWIVTGDGESHRSVPKKSLNIRVMLPVKRLAPDDWSG